MKVPVLARFGGRLIPGSRALEIGCGSGYGSQLILERFGAACVDAVDLDPAMIRRAGRRLARYGEQVRLARGSATDLHAALDAQDASYDAVFDFGIVHHIPDWRNALAEVARVLRPGGRFYFEEVTAHALARPTNQRLFDHPRETGSPQNNSSTNLPSAASWSSARSPASKATTCLAPLPSRSRAVVGDSRPKRRPSSPRSRRSSAPWGLLQAPFHWDSRAV